MKKLKKNALRQSSKLKTKKGMSLMELVVYLAITAIVMVVIIDLTTHLIYSQSKSSQATEVHQNLGFLMEKMTSAIDQASSANGTYPANTLNLTVNGSPVIFALDGNTLTIQEQSQPAQNLSSSKVGVSPPSGGQLFEKITNGSAITIKINLVVLLVSDVNTKQQATTTVMMRGK